MFDHWFSYDMIIKFLRFGVVGFIGFIIDFGLTYLFKEKLRVQKYAANAIGFSVAATVNYFLNRTWTFKSHNPNMGHEFLIFACVAIIGLGLSTIVIWFFNKKCRFNFYLSKLISVGVVMFWNFIINLLYTFV